MVLGRGATTLRSVETWAFPLGDLSCQLDKSLETKCLFLTVPTFRGFRAQRDTQNLRKILKKSRKIKSKTVITQAKNPISSVNFKKTGGKFEKIRSKNVKTQTKKSNFNFKFKKIGGKSSQKL